MVTLEYEPYYAKAIPDGRMSDELYRIKRLASDPAFNHTLEFSTDNIFYLTSLAVAQGEINHQNIFFKVSGKIIPLNRYGQFEDEGALGVATRINELKLREIMRIGPE